MKLISFADIRRLDIPALTCYEWADETIRHKAEAILPPKISMRPAEGSFCNVMPSILPNGMGGVKIVTRYPLREPSLDSKLFLIDMRTGEYLALMDADWITAMRTGAFAAHSIRLFAKKDFATVAMLGLGNTARATMQVLSALYPDRELTVRLLRYKGQEELFAKRFASHENLRFCYVSDIGQLIRGADTVISCVTYTADDLCGDDCFDKGVLVVPVHTRGFTAQDLTFDKVLADDRGHVKDFRNFDRFRSFAEVCDVVCGRAPGRENDDERILAYNIGVSTQDIGFAAQIYALLKESGGLERLPDIDLQGPTEKFWV